MLNQNIIEKVKSDSVLLLCNAIGCHFLFVIFNYCIWFVNVKNKKGQDDGTLCGNQ